MEGNEEISKIPSDEEFARAKKQMKHQSRGVDGVVNAVKKHFLGLCPLHEFWLLAQGETKFEAYVFFEKESDVEACKRSGAAQDIVDFLYRELELAGRGRRSDVSVRFEFDSHENVLAKYRGSYYLRLH